MRIKTIEIYGFGRLEQRKFELNHDLTQIFGANETGKSTMQAFIHALLFGFPKEGDSYRLEPRFSSHYGGKLTLEFQPDEIVTVEREYVKNIETTNIMLNDMKKDEDWLRQKLNYITKETYQNIFSFNVLGLQEVHRQLSEDKLQSYLLQAGAFGSPEFAKMQNHIVSEKQQLVNDEKPGIVNEKYDELLSIESDIRKKEYQFDHYNELLKEKGLLEKEKNQLEAHISQLKDLQKSKQKALAHHESMKEWKQLELKLNITPPVFPEHGIDRYESLKRSLLNTERDKKMRLERKEQLLTEQESLNPGSDELLIRSKDLIKEEESFKSLKAEMKELDKAIQQAQDEKQSLMHDLGWTEYHPVEVGELIKEKIIEETHNIEKLRQSQAQIVREKEFINSSIDNYRHELERLEKDKVHDGRYERALQLQRESRDLNEKSELYHTMKSDAEQYESKQISFFNKIRMTSILLCLLFVAGAIYSYIEKEMIFAGIFGVLAFVSLIFLMMYKRPALEFNHALHDEIASLEESVNHLKENFDLSFDLDTQREIRAMYGSNEDKLGREQSRFRALTEELGNVNLSLSKAEERLEEIKKRLKIPASYESSLLIEAFKNIGRLKQIELKLTDLSCQHDDYHQQLKVFEQNVEDLNKVLPVDLNMTALFHDLKSYTSNEEKTRLQSERNEEQLKLISKEIDILTTTEANLTDEMNKLLSEAGVNDEESYYKQSETFLKYNENLDRYYQLSRMLDEENFSYEEKSELSFISSADLRNEEGELQDNINELIEQRADIVRSLDEIQSNMKTIEDDQSLSTLKYQFEQKKNAFNELLKTYGSVSYIDTLINAHIEGVKEKRLPYVVSDATEIFNFLTEGRYVKVQYQNNTLLVRHQDGQVYHPMELSQSTKELLYIAMRFALIQSLNKYYPFPIIIDDAFVHFDKERRERIIAYISKMKENQVLYYTCNRSSAIPVRMTITLEKAGKEKK